MDCQFGTGDRWAPRPGPTQRRSRILDDAAARPHLVPPRPHTHRPRPGPSDGRGHLTAGLRRYIADRDWLTVFQLPPYAPDLNPVGGIWSVLRRNTTANRAFADPEDLITAVRRDLRQLQHRHDVLAGCLTGTGLRRQPP